MNLRFIGSAETVPEVMTFTFNGNDLPAWLPGQYIKYTLPHDMPDMRGLTRLFTIASAPFEHHIKITTRIDPTTGSTFKKVLLNLPVGSEISASLPSGRFLFDTNHPAIFIAGGIGITPYFAMLRQLSYDNTTYQATLLYANRNENYVYKSEIEAVKVKSNKLKVSYFTDPQQIKLSDIQIAALEYSDPIYYISGPEPMVENYKIQILNSGVGEEMIKTDYFPGYDD